MVYVQLPDAGLEVIANASIAEIESTKSVSEVYAPVTGTVVEVNGTLEETPEQLNTDPYGAGWIFVVELDGPGRRSTRSWTRRRTAPSWRSSAVAALAARRRRRRVRATRPGRWPRTSRASTRSPRAGRPGPAPLHLGPPGAVARPLPAGDRRRPRCVPSPRRGGRAPPDRGPGAAARRGPHLRGGDAPARRARRATSTPLYRTLAGGADRRAGRARGASRRSARDPGPAGPGLLRGRPGRRPAGGGAQALRLGPGPAGRASSSSTARSCSTGSRSTSSTSSTPRRPETADADRGSGRGA